MMNATGTAISMLALLASMAAWGADGTPSSIRHPFTARSLRPIPPSDGPHTESALSAILAGAKVPEGDIEWVLMLDDSVALFQVGAADADSGMYLANLATGQLRPIYQRLASSIDGFVQAADGTRYVIVSIVVDRPGYVWNSHEALKVSRHQGRYELEWYQLGGFYDGFENRSDLCSGFQLDHLDVASQLTLKTGRGGTLINLDRSVIDCPSLQEHKIHRTCTASRDGVVCDDRIAVEPDRQSEGW